MISLASVRFFRKSAAVLALAAALPAVADAATVVSISSNASALKGSLTLLGLTATVGPISSVSGTAGQAYSKTDTFAGVDLTLGLGGLFGNTTRANVITTKASSTFPATPTGSASAEIANLNLAALLDPVLGALVSNLGIQATALSSQTTFDGTIFTGSSSIAGLQLATTIAPLSAVASVPLNPPVNYTLVDLLGLKVTLNEQIGGDTFANGIETKSLTTNALHLSLNNYTLGSSLLSGDIILGQSQVSAQTTQSAVPEPATWGMMIVGFGAMGTMLRTSRRRPAAMLMR